MEGLVTIQGIPAEKLLDCLRAIVREELQNTRTISNKEEILNIKEASKFLGLKVPTIYGLVADNKIPFSKPSKQLFFFKDDLIRWVKEYQVKSIKESTVEAEKNFLKANKKRRLP